MLNRYLLIISFCLLFLTQNILANQKPNLLIYCGITMVKPIEEIAKVIEKKHNCNITISQGGSKDLYQSLKFSKKGDLYLPGSDTYRTKNMKDGLLLDSKLIGHNQAAIFVRKNNPLDIQNLDSFIDENISSTLCNPDSGSIGKMTKNIFLAYKGQSFFDDAYDNTIEIGSDSRNLNKALIDNRVDLTINWKATAYWDENSKYIDIIEINDKYAPKKDLVINLLSFSENKEIALSFMNYAASKKGQEIMKKYGF